MFPEQQLSLGFLSFSVSLNSETNSTKKIIYENNVEVISHGFRNLYGKGHLWHAFCACEAKLAHIGKYFSCPSANIGNSS